jgi:hypothetical protein
MKGQQLLFVVRHYNRNLWLFDSTNAIGTNKTRTKLRLIFVFRVLGKAYYKTSLLCSLANREGGIEQRGHLL